MKAILHILAYIFQNNPWYKIPFRLVLALLYQVQKRTYAGIWSKRLFNGKSILLFPHNQISSGFVYADYIDRVEVDHLRALANANTIFLDIGANIGAYSILMADKVKTVIAFEPHPTTANYCKMNFMLNQIDAHQVVTKAVGVQCEDRYFSNLNEASPVNAFAETQENAILVKTTTLDVFFEHFPIQPQDHFIIKIDVEGYEHEVLQGARQFLRQAPIKAILFEGFSSHHQAIEAQLKALGFKLEIVSKHNILASRSKQEGEACEHKHLIPST